MCACRSHLTTPFPPPLFRAYTATAAALVGLAAVSTYAMLLAAKKTHRRIVAGDSKLNAFVANVRPLLVESYSELTQHILV